MPATRARRTGVRILPAATAGALAAVLAGTPPAPATPSPTPATSATRSPVDATDPGLALTPGAALAEPKILTLDATPLPITQIVEDQPALGHGTPDQPALGHGTPDQPALGHGTPDQPAPDPTGQPGRNQQAPPAAPQPTTSPSTLPPPPPPHTPTPHPSTTQQPTTSPANGPRTWPTAAGLGALLAAALTATLALQRLHHRRAPGTTAGAADSATTQTRKGHTQQAAVPGGLARLDAALRTLAHHTGQTPQRPMPPLRAATADSGALKVLPDDLAQEPQPPFVSGPAGWWAVPADAVLLQAEAAHEVPAPYPGLATIGSTETGDLLLLNLAQLPALLLDGDPLHITEVCTSLALELAMSPWAADVEVVTVGFGEDLPQLLPTARITHLRHATHALRDLRERLLEAHQMPETSHRPYLLLCASPLAEDTAQELADLINKSATVPVTLIAPASTTAAHFPQAETLNATLNEPQPLHHAGTQITVQRLEHAAYQQITTALKGSGQPSHPAQRPGQNVPDEPERNQQPEQSAPADPPSPSVPAPSPTPAAADVNSEVFPALLAATTDPAGPRVLPAAEASTQADDEPGQATEAAPPAAAEPTAEEESAEADDHEDSVEDHKVPEAEDCEAHDLHAPEIRVLGPVEVTGVDSTGHGPRMAQLAALLYFRPGRSADALCADMDPARPWTSSTLNARLQGLRRALGNDPTGTPYVPRRKAGEDPYRLAAGVRCDWTRFLQLVERALPLGLSGLGDLEKALTLVRGKPFGGKPLPWAEPFQQEMITRIIDVAHTVATHRTPVGPHHDLSAARQAVATGLDADDTAELLYRDWMRLEAARGNRSGLHTAITRVQEINRALDCSPEPETEQLIRDLLTPHAHLTAQDG
ncbi:hypothetical protein [Streptomyces sp. NPDC127197]|uniref:AfsR/SARP family transcriptional regulator n=1 Tax=Streptomyces sp. NPDC127197 TaxID=3345388 RepID=UPI00363C8A44